MGRSEGQGSQNGWHLRQRPWSWMLRWSPTWGTDAGRLRCGALRAANVSAAPEDIAMPAPKAVNSLKQKAHELIDQLPDDAT